MTAHNHIIFRITIVAFLAAFLPFIPGCLLDEDDSRGVLIIRGRDKGRLHPGYRAAESEGRDSKTKLWKEIVHEKSGIVLRLVPAGEFDMGSPDSEEGRWYFEGPVHRVKISEPFYIGKYEVTQKEWKAVMEYNPSRPKGDNLPVETASWYAAQEFCWEAGGGLRLPTEAEWEYACRAGSTTKWCFGDNEDTLGEYAWYWSRLDKSGIKWREVGQKKPNDWGLYDMHGNVWEWCEDVWHDSYKGTDRPDDGSAWTTSGGTQSRRVCRGGSWYDIARNTRSASRSRSVPAPFLANISLIGFRVVVAARKNT
ncbi:MAG: formylglycine-generating enzyme family protein [Planctomycetota bacterium]